MNEQPTLNPLQRRLLALLLAQAPIPPAARPHLPRHVQVQLPELAATLGVERDTVRRCLSELCGRKLLKRTSAALQHPPSYAIVLLPLLTSADCGPCDRCGQPVQAHEDSLHLDQVALSLRQRRLVGTVATVVIARHITCSRSRFHAFGGPHPGHKPLDAAEHRRAHDLLQRAALLLDKDRETYLTVVDRLLTTALAAQLETPAGG